MINVRKSTENDIDDICRIYSHARQFMNETGNPNQWKNCYPPTEMIISDIENNISHVIEHDDKVCGVFTFFQGDDPTYTYIEDGNWLSDGAYGTIHRIASDGALKGTVSIATEFAEKTIKNLRIDTHKDNKIMQHVLEKLGFIKCGTIYNENGEPRIAYQRIR